jgi:hypothetical protein
MGMICVLLLLTLDILSKTFVYHIGQDKIADSWIHMGPEKIADSWIHMGQDKIAD